MQNPVKSPARTAMAWSRNCRNDSALDYYPNATNLVTLENQFGNESDQFVDLG